MNPLYFVLLLFVGIPLIELYFLIEVGSVIGALPTIVLTVFTAVLGGLLVRAQGFSTAIRAQKSVAQGELPAMEMLEGVVLLLAGIVLMLPGFFTDAIGFLALVPQIRRGGLLYLLKRAKVMTPAGKPGQGGPESTQGPRVIDGEYRRDDD